jgi:hypothetical protein
MINVSNDAVRKIQDNSQWGGSQQAGEAAIATGLFALANAVETGLVAIAKAIASNKTNTDNGLERF